jgi:predicted dithiol-disulfide oxidoreductase (DUF899 family)
MSIREKGKTDALAYPLLDRAPKGRDETDPPEFWIRRHDEYEHAAEARG